MMLRMLTERKPTDRQDLERVKAKTYSVPLLSYSRRQSHPSNELLLWHHHSRVMLIMSGTGEDTTL